MKLCCGFESPICTPWHTNAPCGMRRSPILAGHNYMPHRFNVHLLDTVKLSIRLSSRNVHNEAWRCQNCLFHHKSLFKPLRGEGEVQLVNNKLQRTTAKCSSFCQWRASPGQRGGGLIWCFLAWWECVWCCWWSFAETPNSRGGFQRWLTCCSGWYYLSQKNFVSLKKTLLWNLLYAFTLAHKTNGVDGHFSCEDISDRGVLFSFLSCLYYYSIFPFSKDQFGAAPCRLVFLSIAIVI